MSGSAKTGFRGSFARLGDLHVEEARSSASIALSVIAL
jgi:hypothetical protein